jgi:magnesium-transporting ATPase (P-type)
MLPFDQTLKRKIVVRSDSVNKEIVRVYLQGAPEEILKLCSYAINDQDQ